MAGTESPRVTETRAAHARTAYARTAYARVAEQVADAAVLKRLFAQRVAAEPPHGRSRLFALSLLGELDRRDHRRTGDLAAVRGVDPSVVSRHVASLQADGLVRREPDPTDRRVARIALTDAGRAEAARIRERRAAWFAQVLADWSVEDANCFATLLARFTADVRRVDDQLTFHDEKGNIA